MRRRIWTMRALLSAAVISAGLIEGSAAFAADRAPRDVKTSFYLIDVMAIDSAAQTVTVDFVVRASWKEPKLIGKSTRTVPIGGYFHPAFQVSGAYELEKMTELPLLVFPDGTVRHFDRYVGKIASKMNLTDFPLDRHTIRISMIGKSPDAMSLRVNPRVTGQARELTVADWKVGQGRFITDTFQIPGIRLTRSTYSFDVERHFGYYIWKIILPLGIIVLMSWTVFWIDPSQFGAQVGTATASMLTLIAYRFSLDNMVPKVSYFTRMDTFITGSTILVFLALVQAIATGRLADSGKTKLAHSLDRACRWGFPALFAGLIGAAFVF